MKNLYSIARRIAAENGDVLDDYFEFYRDGQWIVSVARKIMSVLALLEEKMDNYMAYMPKLEEDIGYIDDEKLDAMDTVSCAKELRRMLADAKKKYSDWENAADDGKEKAMNAYKTAVGGMKTYITSFENSCVNEFRNRYKNDEESVRKLLDLIRQSGNSVLNNNAGSPPQQPIVQQK